MTYLNVSDLVGFIIHNGHATLYELLHVYDLEEAYLIWECDYVPLVNEYIREKERVDKARIASEAKKYLR